MAITDILDELRRDRQVMANVSAWQIVPARPARLAPIPPTLHPLLVEALHRLGIDQLYSHQRQAVTRFLRGEHLAVVTPTASGKTLCYTLPTFHSLLSDPHATALYFFPTKALAHDQLEGLGDWRLEIDRLAASNLPIPDPQSPMPNLTVAAYDGDTPSSQRAQIRRQARLILTNPDMLHVGILPYHAAWADFFANLRLVVIDEMHTYRGVFGSHVANVLRRLKRIAAFYGSRPQFVLTSATIANPQQLAQNLIEEPVTVIDENGAPQGEKHVVLYNPPLYDPEQGLRRSSVLESEALAARLIQSGLQTIVFGRSRLTVEVLLTYLRERLAHTGRGLMKRESKIGDRGLEIALHAPNPQSPIPYPQSPIRGYRGGYLPTERRTIEAGLRDGSVRGVVATNALELGIDIGQLEAAVICGYPGTIASTWQQMGRAGRTADASLAILVATGGALDQYIANHPHYLLERSPEHALIDPDNLMLLVDQIRCAAFELPFQEGERFGNSPFTADVLALLAEQGEVGRHGERYLWQGEGYPARRIGLRSTGGDSVVIQHVDAEGAVHVVGEVDAASAPVLVHEGAVYLHEGQSYRVDELDLAQRLARVSPAEVDFYTEANASTDLTVLAIHDQRAAAGVPLYHGDLLVTTQVTDYRRVRRHTHETLGVFPLDYPPRTLETSGYWFEIPPAVQTALVEAGQWHDSPNDYGPNWQEQRRRVRARDGYRCRECGAPEPPGGQHDVHHLIPFRTFGYVPGINENYRDANRLSNLVLLCRRCHQRMEAGVRTRGGMDGVAYVLRNLAPLHLMCDSSDIGVSVARDAKTNAEARRCGGAEAETRHLPPAPRIYVFERIAAGLGFSRQLFEKHEELLASAEELIRGCGCRYGCPACVGPVPRSGPDETPLLDTKRLALALLAALHGEQPPISQQSVDEVDFWQ